MHQTRQDQCRIGVSVCDGIGYSACREGALRSSVPTITVLGEFQATGHDRSPVRFGTRRSERLLALLVVNAGRRLSRQMMVVQLWPDDMAADTRRLNTELWRLKRVTRDAGIELDRWISSDATGLKFAAGPDEVWVDLRAFEHACEAAEASPQGSDARVFHLRVAVELYRGDVLPGFGDDWCTLRREAGRARYLSSAEMLLGELKARERWPEVAALARTVLAYDPLLEHVHRDLLHALRATGDRAAALAHFRALKSLLRSELGVDPMPETRALAEGSPAASGVSPSRAAVLARYAELIREIDQILGRLERVTDALKRLDDALLDMSRRDRSPML